MRQDDELAYIEDDLRRGAFEREETSTIRSPDFSMHYIAC
jgi:hypothetical protein